MAHDPIITFTTDFGVTDPYVGTMKGVILNINPSARIVDISNAVQSYDVLDGAITISQAYPYFPKNTLHVVIVDPGVGTSRRPIIARTEHGLFLAPDNGVLSGVYEKEQNVVVRNLTSEHYFAQPVSKTFHGRDVFAPVAAWLSKSWQPASMGEEISDYKKFAMPKPKEADGLKKGVVLKVDNFGNLLTNFRAEDLSPEMLEKGELSLQVGSHAITRLVPTFANGNTGEAIAFIGSSGYLEIGVNKGNAAKTLGIGRGAPVLLTKG